MSNSIFEVIDKTGKIVYLTKERWGHIRKDHPQVEQGEIEITLKQPAKIIEISEEKRYFFYYFKHKNLPQKFLESSLSIKTAGG